LNNVSKSHPTVKKMKTTVKKMKKLDWMERTEETEK